MQRLSLLAVVFFFSACIPQATIEPEDPIFLKFVELPCGDLAVIGNGPINDGEAGVTGLELTIGSPYCQLTGCLPSFDGYIRLTYPEDPENAYPNRLEIDVVSGVVIKGRALFSLEGEDVSREALLQVQK